MVSSPRMRKWKSRYQRHLHSTRRKDKWRYIPNKVPWYNTQLRKGLKKIKITNWYCSYFEKISKRLTPYTEYQFFFSSGTRLQTLFKHKTEKRPWKDKITNLVYQTKSSKVISEKKRFFFEFTEKLFVVGGITSQKWKYFQRACVLPVVAKTAEELFSEARFFRYHSPGSEAILHQQVSWLKRRSSSYAPEIQSIREPWKTKNELLFSS